jgi:hypothetical protein
MKKPRDLETAETVWLTKNHVGVRGNGGAPRSTVGRTNACASRALRHLDTHRAVSSGSADAHRSRGLLVSVFEKTTGTPRQAVGRTRQGQMIRGEIDTY